MMKLLVILLIGLVFESTGVVLLKKGMDKIGEMQKVSVGEVLRVVKAGAVSPQILAGVFFEALFFVCLLILMSKSDISFLWPMTGLSFVFATFAAMIFPRGNGFHHALGGGGVDCDRGGIHQLQRKSPRQTAFGPSRAIVLA